MNRRIGHMPSLDEFTAIATKAYHALPDEFRIHLDHVRLVVEDFADRETLANVGLSNPHHLSGIYEGIPMDQKSVFHSGTMPDRIRLFRIPILEEWEDRGDVSLEFMVAHVLIHEVGHHFGLSDETIHWLEEQDD
jgi:predicted Zn-dependent protease with MMP-like domain